MARAISATSLSTSLVVHLRGQGLTLKEIGETVGLSESFISRVANGHRSFTVDHLEHFERKLGQPLPALLLEAEWRDRIPAAKKQEFEDVLRILNDLGKTRRSLRSDEERGTSASAGRKVSSSRRAAG